MIDGKGRKDFVVEPPYALHYDNADYSRSPCSHAMIVCRPDQIRQRLDDATSQSLRDTHVPARVWLQMVQFHQAMALRLDLLSNQ